MLDIPLAPQTGKATIPARMSTYRFRMELRQHTSLSMQAAVTAVGFIIGCLVAATVLVASGVGPGDLITEFGSSIFSNSQSLSAVLVQAAPLLIVGISAAFAIRVRFWNIGIEGQMIFGSIASTAVALHDWGPPSLRIIVMMMAAALAGIAWVFVPAILRIKLGINEIISTLLLNYVAADFLLHLLYGDWRDPTNSFPNSEQFNADERLALLGWGNLTWAVPLALVLAILCWWLLSISRFGFFTRFVQTNLKMSAAVGIPVQAIIFGSALTSGALSGIAGFVITAGSEYRLTQSFYVGYGFSGILIAFLSRCNPIAAIAISLFVAVLFVAEQSLQVFYQIPGSIVQLIQAVIVICVAASEFFTRFRIRLAR
jgi:ABC-type uncharacterized transport system permease subunit